VCVDAVESGHADVLDANLFAEQGVVLQSAVQFRLQLDARVDTVGRPTAGVGDGELGQADHVQDGELDAGSQHEVRNYRRHDLAGMARLKKLFESGFLKRTLNHRRFTS